MNCDYGDTAIRALCRSLGKEYRVCTIDFESVIYRDFGNGFNVEISGVYTTSKTRRATLYLWYGEKQPECLIVKTVRDVQRDEIADAVEGLLHYSYALLADGFNAGDRLSGHQFKITNCMNGRGSYECRRLLRNRRGQIAVISQCKDEDIPIWKVEYGFSCMVFGTFDEAMAFCRGKFTDLDGREV